MGTNVDPVCGDDKSYLEKIAGGGVTPRYLGTYQTLAALKADWPDSMGASMNGSWAFASGTQYTYGGAVAGWVAANPTKLDRYLRIATFGDSTADLSGGGNTNTEKQYFALPTGSAGYAIDSSKATLKDQLRCIYVGGGGIGGQTTQQFLDRGKAAYSATRKAMQDIVATLPDVIQIHGGSINDYSGFTASTPQATIDAVVSRHRQCVEFFTGCGIHVIDPGTYGFAVPGANLSTICSIIVQTNATLKALAAQNPLWHFVDVSGVLHDGTGLYKPGVSSDNTHLNGYGGYLLGSLEKQVLDTLFISGAGGTVIYDSQADFANFVSNWAPANWQPGYNAGKTTINSRTCEAGVFTIDCTLNAADDVTMYIDVPLLFAGASVGDALALEYDITVHDYSTGVKLAVGEKTRITLKDAANTNTIYYEAASAMLSGPKVMQMSVPIAPGSFGSQSQFWMGAVLPGAGRYLIRYRPLRLRKYNVLTA